MKMKTSSSSSSSSSSKRRKVEKFSQFPEPILYDDRISELPEHILHHILSFLPTGDATRTCSLSKTWNAAWSSFPVLEFNQCIFEQSMTKRKRSSRSPKTKLQDFCNYVEKSITRHIPGLSIQKFEIVVYIKGPSLHAVPLQDLHRWLNFSTNNYVQRLALCCIKYEPFIDEWRYVLPESLFSCMSLKELDLFGWKFPERCRFSNSSGIGISLRKLKLCHVYADQQTLQSFLSSCCFIEEVTIQHCVGFQTVKLVSPKLEKGDLVLDQNQGQSLAIKAPNLRSLSYGGKYSATIKSSIMASDCQNIKELIFHDAELTSDIFQVILSKFPVLEKLEVTRCSLPEPVKISSLRSQFDDFSIYGCAKIMETLEPPNLGSWLLRKLQVKSKIELGCFRIMQV